MSESPFSFDETQVEEAQSTGGRRNLVALGALAALVLSGGAYLMLSGGGAEDDEVAFIPKASRPAAEVPTTAEAVTLPTATTVSLGRNPFRALYVQPAAAPAAPSAPATTGEDAQPLPNGSGPIVVTVPQAPSGPASPTTPTAPATPATDAPGAEHELELIEVETVGEELTAVFTFDDARMTVKVGGTFGPKQQVKLIELQEGPKAGQWTAVVQNGDGDPFDLTTGDPVFVR